MSGSFQPRDFMERVVAWPGDNSPGYVNLHWQPPGKSIFYGRPFRDVTEFMDMARYAATKPQNYKEVYFCLSTQKHIGPEINGKPVARRHKDAALHLKALWIDIDVKPDKGYATVVEAVDALFKFIDDADLPKPSALVHSGGGLHVYWISDKPLAVDKWSQYAHGLRVELTRCGLRCDAGLTTDAARVLRVPGTYNNKLDMARPVVLKHLGDDYDFDAEPKLARLATLAPVTATVTKPEPFDLTNFPQGGMDPAFNSLDPVADNLATGLNTHGGNLPLKIELVEKGCLHFHETRKDHGKNHAEPLWQTTLLATTFFEDSEELAHTYSDGHPDYTPEATQKKYEQKLLQREQNKLGWPACTTFEAAGANCKACPFYGKIKSPLNLAERATPVVLTHVNQGLDPDLQLPDKYVLDDNGIINEVVQKTVKGGATIEQYVPLFWSKLRNPVAQGGTHRALLFETSLDLDNWGPVQVEEALIYNDQGLLKQLAACGVKVFVDNEKRVRPFMVAWLTKLDAARGRIDTLPFGWLREGKEGTGKEIGFAYGGKLFMADGTDRRAGYVSQTLEQFYTPCGDTAPWYRVLKSITDQHRPDLEVIAAMSLAAPLMCLLGLHNCTACAWSPETGIGKSTAQIVGLAIWGIPRLTKEGPASSPKGIIHKMGMLKNLPLYWDEIATEEKMNQVRSLLGQTTEGRGGTLLTQGRAFAKLDDWQTLMALCANVSLVENIIANCKGSESQIQRVFEFKVKEVPMVKEDQVTMTVLINSLDYNCGKIGLEYARYLGRNPAKVAEFVQDTLRKFNSAVSHQTGERFRAAMAACVYAGACLANSHLKATFNLDEIWEFLRVEYMKQRQVIVEADLIGGSERNTLAAITEFFKANPKNILWVESLPDRSRGRPAIVYVAGPTRERPEAVHVRMGIDNRIIEISRARLIKFLSIAKYNSGTVLTGLKQHFNAHEDRKVNLAAGSGCIGGPEAIIRIPVPPGSPFVDDLYKFTDPSKRPPDAAHVPTPPDAVPEAPAEAWIGKPEPYAEMKLSEVVKSMQRQAIVASQNTKSRGNPTEN